LSNSQYLYQWKYSTVIFRITNSKTKIFVRLQSASSNRGYMLAMYQTQPENESVNLHSPHRNCIFIFNHGQNRDNCQQTAITCDLECYVESHVAPIIHVSYRPLVHTKLNPFRPTSHHCTRINNNTLCSIGAYAFI